MKKNILIISSKENYVRGKLFLSDLKRKYSISYIDYSGNFFLKNLKLFKILFLKFDLIFILWPLWSSFFILKLLCLFKNKPIIYDAFTLTHEDYLDNFREPNFFVKKFYKIIDNFIFKNSSALVTDTIFHKNKILKLINTEKKIEVIEVSQKNLKTFNKLKNKNKFNLVHAGANRKCHDIPKMINMISKLPKKIKSKIHFKIITIDYFNNYRNLIKNLNCENYIQVIKHLKFNQYLKIIKNSDICLGTFGSGSKAKSIISNFIVTSINYGKVVITSNTPAAKHYLGDSKSIILLKKPEILNFKIFFDKYINSIKFRKSVTGHSKKIFNKNFQASINLKKLNRLIINCLE